MRWFAHALVLTVVVAGCSNGDEQGSAPTSADTVAQALASFDETALDTVVWSSEQAAIERGANVFKWACATCHGPEGYGDGEYELDGDTLHPPSFQDPSWRFRDDPEGLRRYIFAGNVRGMPHWGLRRMTPRDIVALEKYIREDLIRGGD